jgi:hypothetical protein
VTLHWPRAGLCGLHCPLVFRDQQHDNTAAMRSLSNCMTDPLQSNEPRAGRMQTGGDH